MRISLCVPMYNESSIIANTARELDKYMSQHFGDDYEIIFADDGSKDDSAKIVKDLNLPRVRVVGYSNNQGKGCAVRHGILASNGDTVIFTDADLAYGVDVIEEAVEEDEEAEMKRYVCITCGWVYDPEEGDPESGIAPGTPFEDIPDDWTCPACGVGKEYFQEER